MTNFEEKLCTTDNQWNSDSGTFKTCPNGPNHQKFPHKECKYLPIWSTTSFNCLARQDKYPQIFDKPIFNVTSRQGINLNQKLLHFDKSGFNCSKILTMSWKNIKQLWSASVKYCTLKDDMEIDVDWLARLFYLDIGFNARHWIPRDFFKDQ